MRVDLDVIQSFIAQDSHVLDLGCGDGELLQKLREEKNIFGVGLENDPEKINADPYGDGWIVKMQPADDADESGLMSPDDYQALLDDLDA